MSSDQLTCIGLDLAWSANHPSGIAVISGTPQGCHLQDVRSLQADVEIVAYIQQHQGSPCHPTLIAIDAPLRVPNLTGRRQAEADLSQVFRTYHAGAHPANRQLLARDGMVRGEALVSALADLGIPYNTHFSSGSSAVVEVFPHPAMIALFGLNRILPYKARPKRDLATRYQAWQAYQHHLGSLATEDPWLRGTESLLSQDPTQLKGHRLKSYEDQVDALMCAYIALYAYRWGSQRCRVFGTLKDGSILTPVPLGIPHVGSL